MKYARVSLVNNTETSSAFDYYDSFSEKKTFLSHRIALIENIVQQHRKRYGKYRVFLLSIIAPAIIISLGAPLWILLHKNSGDQVEEQTVVIQEADNSSPKICLMRPFCIAWNYLIMYIFACVMFSAILISWRITRAEKQLIDTVKATLQMFNQQDNRREINWRFLNHYEHEETISGSEFQEVIAFEYGRVIPEILTVGIERYSGDSIDSSTIDIGNPTSAANDQLEKLVDA